MLTCEDWQVRRKNGRNEYITQYRVKIFQSRDDVFYPQVHPPTFWKLIKYCLFNWDSSKSNISSLKTEFIEYFLVFLKDWWQITPTMRELYKKVKWKYISSPHFIFKFNFNNLGASGFIYDWKCDDARDVHVNLRPIDFETTRVNLLNL